ncbi:hypothetical protein NJH47_05320 [Pseudomonas guariconensis]|nr:MULTISPECIES: hypothetical protein [Pseudomonas]MCO7564459.1 hypothetical protein [Pseudomonas mosselii]MCO7615861.1 hypothetical protein [Pseudomonas guariconensis]
MGMIIATSMIIAIIGADDHSCRDRPTALNTPWTTGRVVDARVVRMPLNPPIEVGPDGLARVELRIEATDRMVATYALSVTFEAENGDSIKANTFLIDM